jgi:hypothetical protein
MRIEIPLRERVVSRVPCLRAEVMLRARTRFGDFVPVPFVVDTGADLTVIPVSLAERDGIPFPRTPAGVARGLLGQLPRFLGTFHVALAGREYDWPCSFLQTPASGPEEVELTPVLGRAGLLWAFDLQIDGEFLTLVRRDRGRRWLRSLHRLFARPFTRRRALDESL